MSDESSNTDSEGGDISSIRKQLEQSASQTVFQRKELVDPSTVVDEDRIVGRDKQLNKIINILSAITRGDRPSNLFLWGPSGTGKSLLVNAVGKQVRSICDATGIDFGVLELNCEPINSLDEAVYRLVESCAEDAGVEVGIPAEGISTNKKYQRLYELIEEQFDAVLIILDEIDTLIGHDRNDKPAHSHLLYQLSRSKENNIDSKISIAAITNRPKFLEDVGGRAESSFNPQNVQFPDYNANELQAILRHREDAFKDGVLGDEVIPLAAALAAQDHGDARKAIDLLRFAGEEATERNSDKVSVDHVHTVQDRAAADKTIKLMPGLASHKQFSIFSTALVSHHSDSLSKVPSSVGYTIYEETCSVVNREPKSQETFNRYHRGFENNGIISITRTSRGPDSGQYLQFTFLDSPKSIVDAIISDQKSVGSPDLVEHLDKLERTVRLEENDWKQSQ